MVVDFTQRRNCSYFSIAISSAQRRRKNRLSSRLRVYFAPPRETFFASHTIAFFIFDFLRVNVLFCLV